MNDQSNVNKSQNKCQIKRYGRMNFKQQQQQKKRAKTVKLNYKYRMTLAKGGGRKGVQMKKE